SIREIWYDSDAFNRFRGFDWMKEPCRSCEEKTIDAGGCRCQAYLLTGDPANADPVCDKSPHHEAVINVVRKAAAQPAQPVQREPDEQPILFRNDGNSRRLAASPDGRNPDHRNVTDLAGAHK
ncbi:MAG: PqqA peptide cyclase, partial [Caballeronia sp.]|nr:PqqA peptide cyclase [Caballeronia sp.]